MKKQVNKRKKAGRKKQRTFLAVLKEFFSICILAAFTVTLCAPVSLAADRMAEGVQSVAKGTVSIPAEIAKESNDSNIIQGVVVGSIKGTLCTVGNVIEGVFKIITFPAKGQK